MKFNECAAVITLMCSFPNWFWSVATNLLSFIDTTLFGRDVDSSIERQVSPSGANLAAIPGMFDSGSSSPSVLCWPDHFTWSIYSENIWSRDQPFHSLADFRGKEDVAGHYGIILNGSDHCTVLHFGLQGFWTSPITKCSEQNMVQKLDLLPFSGE